MTNSLVR